MPQLTPHFFLALLFTATLASSPALAAERAKAALEEPTTVTFINQPLKDVLTYFSLTHKVSFAIDASLPKDLPLTGAFKGQKLGEVLDILLSPSKISFTPDGDEIIISPDKKRHTSPTRKRG